MTDAPRRGDFDARPPMPVTEYEQTVKRVNAGYDLVMTLTGCFLRALQQPDLQLLVVGAGGGAEIHAFLPGNPGWRLTGVDPSQDMLALAQAKAEQLRVQERVDLVRGTVDDLPAEGRFDAATCLFVLALLAGRRQTGALTGHGAPTSAQERRCWSRAGSAQRTAACRRTSLAPGSSTGK